MTNMKAIRRTRAYVLDLLDAVFGALYGQPCELCHVRTTLRCEDHQGRITWCAPCARAEFRRFGL